MIYTKAVCGGGGGGLWYILLCDEVYCDKLNFILSVLEEFVLLKSSRQPQFSMINESEVMVTVHVDIYNIQVSYLNHVGILSFTCAEV